MGKPCTSVRLQLKLLGYIICKLVDALEFEEDQLEYFFDSISELKEKLLALIDSIAPIYRYR